MIDGTEPLSCDVLHEVRRTAVAANSGDLAARFELCQLLDTHSMIWRTIADLAHRAEEQLITLAANGEVLQTESIRRATAAMRAELGAESDGLLQKLVIERVVATWLHVQIAEVALAAATSKKDQDRCRRNLALASRQHLEAVTVLASLCPRAAVSAEVVRMASGEPD